MTSDDSIIHLNMEIAADAGPAMQLTGRLTWISRGLAALSGPSALDLRSRSCLLGAVRVSARPTPFGRWLREWSLMRAPDREAVAPWCRRLLPACQIARLPGRPQAAPLCRLRSASGRDIRGFRRRDGDQYICWPPLTESVEPVMKPASSATRNSTARAISSALPSRPTGMRAMIFSSTSAGTARTISVST